jgi:hypothetical protein
MLRDDGRRTLNDGLPDRQADTELQHNVVQPFWVGNELFLDPGMNVAAIAPRASLDDL